MTPSRAAQEKPTSPRTEGLHGAIGKHYPRTGDAIKGFLGGGTRTQCDGCGVPMVLADGRWSAVAEREAAAATPSLDVERLRSQFLAHHTEGPSALDAALSEERRLTVERIRAEFSVHEYGCHECDNAPNLHRILDEIGGSR